MTGQDWNMRELLERHDVLFTTAPSQIEDALPFGNGRFGGLVYRPGSWEWIVGKLDVDIDLHRDYAKDPDCTTYRTWELGARYEPRHDEMREAVRRKDERRLQALHERALVRRERRRTLIDDVSRLPSWFAGNLVPAWLRVHSGGNAGKMRERLDLYRGEVTAHCEDGGRRYRMGTVVDPREDVFAVTFEAADGRVPIKAVELFRPPHDAYIETRPQFGRTRDCMWVDFELANHFRYAVAVRVHGADFAARRSGDGLTAQLRGGPDALTLYVSCMTCMEADDPRAAALDAVSHADVRDIRTANRRRWRGFWEESAVEIGDDVLENLYYFHQYAFACTHGRGIRAKYKGAGLYGLWTHSDHITWSNRPYRDVNIEMAYQHVMASNHLAFFDPFIDLVHAMMPEATLRSREKYGVDEGAAFYGNWQCAGPWMAILLWERYRHDLDAELLRERIYPIMRAVGLLGERLFEEDEQGDLYYFGSAPPERGNLTDEREDAVGFSRIFRDVAIDLAFFKYLYQSLVRASDLLGVDAEHARRWQALLARFPRYPTGETEYGKAIFDLAEYDSPHLCHHPNTLAPVYPARELHLSSPERQRKLGEATVRSCWNNISMVYTFNTPWVATAFARMGLADETYAVLDRWIVDGFLNPSGFVGREINEPYRSYHRLMVGPQPSLPPILETGCGTIAAVNEMLLQEHDGVLFVFPAVPDTWKDVRFRDLRAPGAFLVSAERIGGQVAKITIQAEQGGQVRVHNPWQQGVLCLERGGKEEVLDVKGDIIAAGLGKGEAATLRPVQQPRKRRPPPKNPGKPKVKRAHRGFHRFIGMDPETRMTRRIERSGATIYGWKQVENNDPSLSGSHRRLIEIPRNLYFRLDFGATDRRAATKTLYGRQSLEDPWLPLGPDTTYENIRRYGWIEARALGRDTVRRGHPLTRKGLRSSKQATLGLRLDEGSYELLLIHGPGDRTRTKVRVPDCGVQAVFETADQEASADSFGMYVSGERVIKLVLSTDRGHVWRVAALLVKRVW